MNSITATNSLLFNVSNASEENRAKIPELTAKIPSPIAPIEPTPEQLNNVKNKLTDIRP